MASSDTGDSTALMRSKSSKLEFQVSSFRFQVDQRSSFRYQGSIAAGFKFQVSCFRVQGSGFKVLTQIPQIAQIAAELLVYHIDIT